MGNMRPGLVYWPLWAGGGAIGRLGVVGRGLAVEGRVGQAMSGSVTEALTQLLSLPLLSTLHCPCGWRGHGTQI